MVWVTTVATCRAEGSKAPAGEPAEGTGESQSPAGGARWSWRCRTTLCTGDGKTKSLALFLRAERRRFMFHPLVEIILVSIMFIWLLSRQPVQAFSQLSSGHQHSPGVEEIRINLCRVKKDLNLFCTVSLTWTECHQTRTKEAEMGC